MVRPTAALAACAALLVTSCSPTSSPPPAPRPHTALNCPGGTLKGEGASSQRIVMEEVIKSYTTACPGTFVEYTSSGSGAGVKAFLGGAVDWAGADAPLRSVPRDGVVEAEQARRRCNGNEAWNLPMVLGPIAVGYRLDGVGELSLSSTTVAQIFNGHITRWDDPTIVAENPGVTLPDARIAVFHRADESGTTENFTEYLAEAAGDAWPHEPAKAWPGLVGEGKEKSAGVAEAVTATQGAISYMEWGAALERDIAVAHLDGVELTPSSAAKGIEAATVGEDLRLTLDHTPGADAYGAVMPTYEVVCSAGGTNPALMRDFLGHFISPEVQASLESLGHAPLPDPLREKVAQAISEIA
ncbi:MAG: phosphate ABC transporter substrate-binding protein PstS [Propionibacteriaceae bacterium]|nr:phosphate ABC transporter substrate-binding protein PstS [Propionibacteriaceae bacterium]